MIEQDQIKALAELDGFHFEEGTPPQYRGTNKRRGWTNGKVWMNEPRRYPTSYDAIIPLIIKRLCKIESSNMERYDKFGKILSRIRLGYDESTFDYAAAFVVFMRATTQQLCEALLRYEGKWIV